MQVSVVGQVFGEEGCGVVHQFHMVEKLGKARITIIIKQIAENFNAIVDDDMHILESVETVGFLEEIGRVAKEIGRVVAHLDIADEPLHVAHAFGERGHIVMLDMDAGFLALHGVLLLSHNGLRQQEEKRCYEQQPGFHHFN